MIQIINKLRLKPYLRSTTHLDSANRKKAGESEEFEFLAIGHVTAYLHRMHLVG